MQRWEYLFAMIDYGAQRVRLLNGIELKDWKKGPSAFDFFNQLGNEGWELVAHVAGTGGGLLVGHTVFKRPRI